MSTRVDLYRLIHKALRAVMSQTLLAVGRADCEDEGEVAQALEQVELLVELCRDHLDHENRFIHSAIEERVPGAAMHTAYDHLHQQSSLNALAELCLAITRSASIARSTLMDQLYRQLARFVEDNFEHMRYEETENNAILWAAYTDPELLAIERNLVASIPHGLLVKYLRNMLPAVSHSERIDILLGLRAVRDATGFAEVLDSVESRLSPREIDKLHLGLGLASPQRAAA